MNKKYQIFARKYRPQSFKDIVGQEPIVITLKNSLKLNKTTQAYLFVGPRGIGKTTITRILAKALNCSNLIEQEPCNKCQSCLEITNCNSLDVIEIDGASNRGIDDIRQINNTIGYAPSANNKYKIYIIDEVHMLTKEAFNALLKTLEEPPASIKFFFATTEPHKVLPTIISRCQRFDLKPISPSLIVDKLNFIMSTQNREITPDALHLIAKISDGSLRDAESMLDQIICFSEKTITTEILNQIFGLISQDSFFQLDQAVKDQNIEIAFKIVNSIYKEGKDFSYFLEELIEHFRKILIIKTKKNIDFLVLPDSLKGKYLESEKIFSKNQCLYILELLLKNISQLQQSSSKKCLLEMLLIQIIRINDRIPIQALIKRLINLENNLNKIPKEEQKKQTPLTTHKIELEEVPFMKDQSLKENKSIQDKSLNNISDQKKPVQEKLSQENSSQENSSQENSFQKNSSQKNSIPQNLSQDISLKQNMQKSRNHYDTLLNFTAVELEGIIKKD